MGTLYLRGKTWWIKYYRNGKPYFESTHTKNDKHAMKKLQARMGQIESGTFTGVKVDKVLYDELAEDLINDYKINNRKSLGMTQDRLAKHLKPYFTGIKACNITTDLIQKYILKRQKQEASNGTINRELAALKRMFTLALR